MGGDNNQWSIINLFTDTLSDYRFIIHKIYEPKEIQILGLKCTKFHVKKPTGDTTQTRGGEDPHRDGHEIGDN